MKKKIKRKHRYHVKQKPNFNWVYKINSTPTQREEVLLAYHSSPGLTMTVYGPRYGVTNYLSNDSLKEGETMGTIQYFDVFNSYANTSREILKNVEEGKYD